jgi:PAS domain S-box-containing protein
LGYGWLEATHPEDKETSGKAFINANEEQTHFRVEYRLKDKFGNYRWAIDSGNARFDAHGKYLGMAGTVFDIHDEVEARQAMQETNRKLETIVNSISEGLIIADSDGQIILWNPASIEQHGFVNQEALLHKLQEFPKLFRLDRLDGTVLQFDEWPMSRVLRGESFKEFEVKVHRMDTGYTWIASYSGTPIKDAQGRIMMGLITVRDVTRQITSELDLRKAVNARDEFMSIVSHELKTPLTSLKLQTQSAKRKLILNQLKDMAPEKMIQVFTQNENQINRLVRLVDDMLDLTRVQSGRLSYHLSEVDLCSVLTEVSERLREQFEHAKIELHLNCAGSAVGSFDRERIEQVVINLLTNALKYGQNRPVKIDLINDVQKARIEVTDQGLGISPENQLIVFNRFERVVSANEISGLGIGLFITKEIVEAHGGRI